MAPRSGATWRRVAARPLRALLLALEPVAEEPTARSRVRVVVVGDVAHVVVDVVLELEVLGHDGREPPVHVLEMVGRRFHAVEAPHHYRHRADLTFGDPA